LSVSAAGLDHLVVSPAKSSVVAGGSQTYTVEGSDAFGNDLGDMTGEATFSVSTAQTAVAHLAFVPLATSAGSCAGATCSPPTKVGSYSVVAAVASKTATATLAVTPAALDHLVLSPEHATVAAGGSQAYLAEGYDAFGNDLGDVTNQVSFTIAGGGSCQGAVCTPPAAAGAFTVSAADGAASGTATLTVTPATGGRGTTSTPAPSTSGSSSTPTPSSGMTPSPSSSSSDTAGSGSGGPLAFTGASVERLLGLAVVVLLTGAGLVLASRRRRSRVD
jgi:hypothetical protein